MILLESIHMNRASFGNMTKSCEISVSIWEDLVLAPKRFKECAQNHFWHVFSFLLSSLHANLFLLLRSFQFDEYELCLLWKTDKFLRDKCLYFGQYGIGCQVFRRVHPKSFLPSFEFFYSVYQMLTFFFCWLTLLFESIHATCACSVRVTESLEISVFIWNDMIFTAKSFEECTHNLFW